MKVPVLTLRDKKWIARYIKLRNYVCQNGGFPPRIVSDPLLVSMCNWYTYQKRIHTMNKSLDSWQIALLEQLPGWSWNQGTQKNTIRIR